MEHFLLHCSVLDEIRKSAYHDMDNEYYKLTQMKLEDLTVKKKIAVILDCSILLNNSTYQSTQQSDYKESISIRISLSEIHL